MSAVCERCSVSGVCGVNQPIVLDHVHHPGSPENELPCRGKTPRPHRPHRGSWPFALHQRYAPLSLTYSSTVTRLWMDFSRQILIESSVTSLGLKQMSISNYGSWSRSVFHFCFAWHPHLFYIPISPVRWDRVCFCTLSLNSYSITSKFLPRTFGDMVDNIWVIGSHYNVFWRTKLNIYIIYTLAFWSYWYQAIIPLLLFNLLLKAAIANRHGLSFDVKFYLFAGLSIESCEHNISFAANGWVKRF